MSEPLKKTKKNAQPMPRSGKTGITAVREGLAMVMDGLRVMAENGVTVTRPYPFQNGRLLLPAIEFRDHSFGVVTEEGGRPVFTIDGKSVMERWTELVTEEAK